MSVLEQDAPFKFEETFSWLTCFDGCWKLKMNVNITRGEMAAVVGILDRGITADGPH